MSLENVRLEDGNVCTDLLRSYASSFSYEYQSVLEVDLVSGAVHKSWPADSFFTEVFSLEFDGFFWWTLEKQTGGFVVRKWRRKDNIFAQLVDSFSYSGYSSSPEAMAVEYYSTQLVYQTNAGSLSFEVDDATEFRVGATVVIGPSEVVGYTGEYNECVVSNIIGDTIYVSSGFTSNQHSGAGVYAARAFWVFVDGIGGVGELVKYSTTNGRFLLSDSGTLYDSVFAATFFSGKIIFNKGMCAFHIAPSSLVIDSSMAVDNVEADRSTPIRIYDMYGYGDYLYRLQMKTSYKDSGTWYDEEWDTYNTVSSKTVSEVFMISLRAEKKEIHAIDAPYVTTASSEVYCTVYDQYFSPVSAEVVNFTTTAGSFTSSQEITDTNGQCSTIYIGDSSIGLVTITAEV